MCDLVLTDSQVCARNAVGLVPSLPDLSQEPFMWTSVSLNSSQAVPASSMVTAEAAATTRDSPAADVDLFASGTGPSDVDNGNGVEQVLLEEQLVVKATLNDPGGNVPWLLRLK